MVEKERVRSKGRDVFMNINVRWLDNVLYIGIVYFEDLQVKKVKNVKKKWMWGFGRNRRALNDDRVRGEVRTSNHQWTLITLVSASYTNYPKIERSEIPMFFSPFRGLETLKLSMNIRVHFP